MPRGIRRRIQRETARIRVAPVSFRHLQELQRQTQEQDQKQGSHESGVCETIAGSILCRDGLCVQRRFRYGQPDGQFNRQRGHKTAVRKRKVKRSTEQNREGDFSFAMRSRTEGHFLYAIS